MQAYREQYERVIEHIRGINHVLNEIAPGASPVVRAGLWAVRYGLMEVEAALHVLLKAFETMENEEKTEGKGKNEEKDS